MFAVFGIGYLAATLGFFFILLASFELETTQRKWLSEDLIYKERNIGQGPDPWLKEKKVEVYKTINWLPVFAIRTKAKTYNTMDFPLQQNLSVTYSEVTKTVYLKSVVEGYKVFKWSDSIHLVQRY